MSRFSIDSIIVPRYEKECYCKEENFWRPKDCMEDARKLIINIGASK